ncbi:MAG TPA: hypothetical protein VK524_17875 [Polyangiaceae bacterium]|nr:hypothetical protein [Polyangiaceae bacterium]
MLRATSFGLAFALIAVSWSCSDDDKNSEFDPNTGGSAGASGQGGSGGTGNGGTGGSILPQDGGGSGGTGTRPNTPVQVIITADNAYGFGYGTGTALLNYFGGIENPNSEDIFACPVRQVGNDAGTGIFGPEAYEVPATDANVGNYLYIIGYADKSTTQGVIAKFSREGAAPVYTGMGPWQACATGLDYDLNQNPKGPTRQVIDQYIVRCNSGDLPEGTSSKGWVTTTQSANGSVAFGEDNSTERDAVTPQNPFKIACDIEPSARWMWYDWDPVADQSPFMWPGGSANTAREFIIFRLGAEFIPEPPE